jgi:hypothetical protein
VGCMRLCGARHGGLCMGASVPCLHSFDENIVVVTDLLDQQDDLS